MTLDKNISSSETNWRSSVQMLTRCCFWSQYPGNKFGCDTVCAQFFHQNLLACPTNNSHLLNNVANGPVSILTDELLNSCNCFRSCTTCGSPCVFVILNRYATSLESGMPLKHLCTTQALVPKSLLNHCEGLHSTFPKISTKFDAHSLFLSLIHHENHHRSPTWLQINAYENCPHPPSYVQLGTLTH